MSSSDSVMPTFHQQHSSIQDIVEAAKALCAALLHMRKHYPNSFITPEVKADWATLETLLKNRDRTLNAATRKMFMEEEEEDVL